MTRCQRCGEPFELRHPTDRHCSRCDREVAQIVAADAKRRAYRWPPKDLSWQRGLVL
jgi:DNA-directed RNA polymerase subunit RPC12/RpoP